ncbi:MAG: HD domain-containing protein [Spirulinaceae cyanobacterium SM2_1_0]|nr:HD domain-containing protein [Spirulinaceae cyanobacterium SM2_1_0]
MRDRVLTWLAAHVPAKRRQHILGVEQTAAALAEHYGLPVAQAAQAGLLHDLAKYFKPERLLAIAHTEGWELDPILVEHPHLLHADASAVIARDEFGIGDAEILAAIRNHTLGQPGMSELSCVVYVADAIEPGRGDDPALVALRQVCWQSLPQAVWRVADYSLQHLLAHNRPIHLRTVLTRNWALAQARPERETLRKDRGAAQP